MAIKAISKAFSEDLIELAVLLDHHLVEYLHVSLPGSAFAGFYTLAPFDSIRRINK